MPPEQAEGAAVDERADVWALGATLYHVLAGRPPFSGKNDAALLVQVLHGEPDPLAASGRRVPRDLETIALRCLEKDKAKRYASPGEVADDLGRWLDGEPILARRPGVVSSALRRYARRAGPIAVAFAIVFSVQIVI